MWTIAILFFPCPTFEKATSQRQNFNLRLKTEAISRGNLLFFFLTFNASFRIFPSPKSEFLPIQLRTL